MSEEKIKGWIVRQFKDKDADPSEMENWLLENSENPYFDTIMQELLDDVDYYDPVDSSRGYSLFKAKISREEAIPKLVYLSWHGMSYDYDSGCLRHPNL